MRYNANGITLTQRSGQVPSQRSEAPTMRRIEPGLYEGQDVRAERTEGGWRVDVRTRDVTATLSGDHGSGLREYHPEGTWTPIGTLRTLHAAEVALRALKEGTHFVRMAHSSGEIPIPTLLVPYAEAHRLMVEYGLVDAPEAPAGP